MSSPLVISGFCVPKPLGLPLLHRPEEVRQRFVSSFNFLKTWVVPEQLARRLAYGFWYARCITCPGELFEKTHCFQECASSLVRFCHVCAQSFYVCESLPRGFFRKNMCVFRR